MIFDITPYRTDKNIGKAYNERIDLLPDDAWIIVRDGDCMYLTPDYGAIIEDIIKDYGNDYALIGALTNRLADPSKLYGSKFSEEMDIKEHYNIAMSVKRDKSVKEVDICAGFFMMFKKSTWEKVGGFVEGVTHSDMLFSRDVRKKVGKVGIAQNLYLFHAYRIWEQTHEKAAKSIHHLL